MRIFRIRGKAKLEEVRQLHIRLAARGEALDEVARALVARVIDALASGGAAQGSLERLITEALAAHAPSDHVSMRR